MSRPRIRTLKPENWEDEAVGRCSRDARLLRDVLITFADDDGRWRHLASAIIGHGYPYDDDVTAAKIKRWTQQLIDNGLVIIYEHGGVQYGCFPTWHAHQNINRYKPSDLPGCDDARVIPRPADVEGEGAGRRGATGYKKAAVPERVRREVARRYGAEPSQQTAAACEICGREGVIDWTGSPSWVVFSGLELDHKIPEIDGGSSDDPENLWLLCRACNRRKGTRNGPVREPVSDPVSAGVEVLDTRASAQGHGSTIRSVPDGEQEGSVARETSAPSVRYHGKKVSPDVVAGAQQLLAAFNDATGRSLGTWTADNKPSPSVKQIIGAMLQRPDVTVEQWETGLRRMVASPPSWIDGGVQQIGQVFGEKAAEWALAPSTPVRSPTSDYERTRARRAAALASLQGGAAA